MPYDVCLYRHAVMAFKQPKNNLCEDEFVQLNFQLVDKERISKINFIKRQNYDVGKNILLNRMHVLNNKIDENWLDLSLNSFKLKCKDLYLKNN